MAGAPGSIAAFGEFPGPDGIFAAGAESSLRVLNPLFHSVYMLFFAYFY